MRRMERNEQMKPEQVEIRDFGNHDDVCCEIEDFVNDFMAEAPDCDAGGCFRVTIEYFRPRKVEEAK